MLAAYAASAIGIISTNDVIQKGIKRRAFGATYTTDFAAHVFYLILVDNYLNFKKTSIWRCLFYLVCAYVIWVNCFVRLDTILIILLVGLDLFIMLSTKVKGVDITKYRGSGLIRALLSGVYLIAVAISFCVALYYNKSAFLQELDLIFSRRLSLTWRSIELYGFPLFGKHIEMVGSATLSRSAGRGLEYFFVDNSYVYVMLRYGVVILALLIYQITIFINKRIQKKDSILPFFWAMIAISSTVDHHLLSVYNPFLFALGAVITDWVFVQDVKFLQLSHGKLKVGWKKKC